MRRLFLFFAVLFLFQVANAQEKEWTMLVFLNGNNNLDEFGDLNINQMEMFGSTDQVNLVVQRASARDSNTQRLFIKKDSDKNQISSPAVETLPRVDMGDYKNFVEFVLWGAKNFPAKKYFVVIWNHGSGWHSLLKTKFRNLSLGVDISNDDFSGNKITTVEMGYAFQQIKQVLGKKIELYGSDACLMQMLEVAYEIKDGVSYVLGSQELEPGEGWPYHRFLSRWLKNPSINGAELGKIITEEYLNQYPDANANPLGTTLSVVDNNYIDDVVAAVKLLKEDLNNVSNKSSISNAASGTQSFYYNDYKDLAHFQKRLKDVKVVLNDSTALALERSLSNFIVHSVNSDLRENANGISLWIPSYKYYYDEHSSEYTELAFDRETQWSDFLKTLN